MNTNSRIQMLRKLWFNKAVRRWKWYTYFEYVVLVWIVITWVLTYLDTSIVLTTKVILIMITAKLWFLITTKYEDLSFFQSMRLVYSYYFSPKLYLNLWKWFQYNQKEIEVDMQWEELLRNPDRKVVIWWQVNLEKIKRVEETKAAQKQERVIKISNEKQKVEILDETVLKDKQVNTTINNKVETVKKQEEVKTQNTQQVKRIRRL